MASFNKFFTTVFLAVAYTSSASGVPSPNSPKATTYRSRSAANDVHFETFNPLSTFEVSSFLGKHLAFFEVSHCMR